MVGGFVLGMPSRRTNNFPKNGRGLGHVTPTIFDSTVGYPSDSLASCLYKWLHCIYSTTTSGQIQWPVRCPYARVSHLFARL